MSIEIGKLASAVANCGLGISELRVKAERGGYFFLTIEDGVPRMWSQATVLDNANVPMTDAQALSEIEEAKRILDKHHDSGFLLGVWHERDDGICYRYADGRYDELVHRDTAGEAA